MILYKVYYLSAEGKKLGAVKILAPTLDKALEIGQRSCKNGETIHRIKVAQ